jgi:hypothetical protein
MKSYIYLPKLKYGFILFKDNAVEISSLKDEGCKTMDKKILKC